MKNYLKCLITLGIVSISSFVVSNISLKISSIEAVTAKDKVLYNKGDIVTLGGKEWVIIHRFKDGKVWAATNGPVSTLAWRDDCTAGYGDDNKCMSMTFEDSNVAKALNNYNATFLSNMNAEKDNIDKDLNTIYNYSTPADISLSFNELHYSQNNNEDKYNIDKSESVDFNEPAVVMEKLGVFNGLPTDGSKYRRTPIWTSVAYFNDQGPVSTTIARIGSDAIISGGSMEDGTKVLPVFAACTFLVTPEISDAEISLTSSNFIANSKDTSKGAKMASIVPSPTNAVVDSYEIIENKERFTVDEEGNINISSDKGLDAGDYKLSVRVTDFYGNKIDVEKTITINPALISDLNITYNNDKNVSEFRYGDNQTIGGGTIGTLSYVKDSNTYSDGNFTLLNDEGGNFVLSGSDVLVVGGKSLSVGTHTFEVKVEDPDHNWYTKTITFEVKKKLETMEWNTTTKNITDKYYGDSFTIGTTTISGVTVSYVSDNTACANISNTGQVTLTCIPASGKVTFTASGTSDTAEYEDLTKEVNVLKRPITLKTKVNNKDSLEIQYGDALPTPTFTLSNGSYAGSDNASSLGTPVYKYKNGNTVVSDPNLIPKEETYDLIVEFTGGMAANYDITYESAKLKVKNEPIINSEYFTLSGTKGKEDWYRSDVVIQPIHNKFDNMSVNNGGYLGISKPYTFTTEGENTDVPLKFKSSDDLEKATTQTIKIDKTAPLATDITYTAKTRSLMERLLNAVSFDHYFSESQTATFSGTDENGSGIDTFQYEVVEVDDDKKEINGTKKTGEGDHVDLEVNKNYKITVKAVDIAGNVSTEAESITQYVKLSNQTEKLNFKAYLDGDKTKPYDGTSWTYLPITVELDGGNVKGYKYKSDSEGEIDLGSSDTFIINADTSRSENYTMTSISQTNIEAYANLPVKIDIVKPQISITGTSNEVDINSGDTVEHDVTLTIHSDNTNLSGVTYYYTDNADIIDTNPLKDKGWSVSKGTIQITSSGTKTYYVKAVSGAGKVSEVETFEVTINKKEYNPINVDVKSNDKAYTPGSWTNHDITFYLSGGLDGAQIERYQVAVTDGNKPADSDWGEISGPDHTHQITENTKDKTFWFRVVPIDPKGSISRGIKVRLDVDSPNNLEISAKTKVDKKDIVYDVWTNKDVEVKFKADDNYTSSDVMRYQYKEITKDGESDWLNYDGSIIYKNGTNVKVKMRAIDQAGNISTELETAGNIMVDTVKPIINGAKDGLKYSDPITVTYDDVNSGIDLDKTIYKLDGVEYPFISGTTFDKKGEYELFIYDKAGNVENIKFTYSDRKSVVADDKTNVEIEGVDTDFDKDTELVVDDITENAKDDVNVNDGHSIVKVYDVFIRVEGKKAKFDGTVKVKIPYDGSTNELKVYALNEDGTKSEITYKYQNGVISFETDILQKYVITAKEAKVCTTKELNIDTDGDGLPDVNVDTNNDCVADINIDTTGNRIPDINIDTTGDGQPNINVDTNGDGRADINIAEKIEKWTPKKDCKYHDIAYDTMEDITARINVDSDGDGKPDKNIDTDGDGIPDKNLDDYWKEKLKQNEADETKSVKGSSIKKAMGGAMTGDHTKWEVWLLLMIVTLILMSYSVYRNKTLNK